MTNTSFESKTYVKRKKQTNLATTPLNRASDEWTALPWPEIHRQVTSLGQQIFLANLRNNPSRMRTLQRRALRSKAVLAYAVRRVTMENSGRGTPGPDRQIYLTPQARMQVYKELCGQKLDQWTPSPVRRVYISRPGKSPRPLGLPNIKDRIVQTVVKVALEPEWEALFEHGSYGFRPERGPHDAMMRIWRTLNSKSRVWVLDADIKGCFDTIAHEPLLNILQGFPAVDLIGRWLKAGHFRGQLFTATDVGTPQGGVISPLLANIALHGMEELFQTRYHKHGYVREQCPWIVIRYADDFLIMTRTKELAAEAKERLTPWLSSRGMAFAPDKTAIRSGYEGFDFLGWTFRLYPKLKGKKAKKAWNRSRGSTSEYVTLVTPSQDAIQHLKDDLKQIWRRYIGSAAHIPITKLNSRLRGWANYHATVNANKAFRSVDHFNYLQAVRYARRTHPNKGWDWIKQRYFRSTHGTRWTKTGALNATSDNWTFFSSVPTGKPSRGAKTESRPDVDASAGINLIKMRHRQLTNHTSTKYNHNPYRPTDRAYFESRRLKRKLQKGSFKLALHQNQGGWCPVCQRPLVPEDWDEPYEVHHLKPIREGGDNRPSNLMLLHRQCHHIAHNKLIDSDTLQARLASLKANPLSTPGFKPHPHRERGKA